MPETLTLPADVTIWVGDVFKALALMDDDSIDCVVTSPPYWGLRDYGVEGQIGMEPSLAEHIEILIKVFREVRRVMKPEATLWLNYGDCYASSVNGRSAADTKAAGNDDRTFRDKPFSTVGPILGHSKHDENRQGKTSKTAHEQSGHGYRVMAGGYLKPKDLCMVANRLAIALQDDGWWVRSEIIWHKTNPMPESVTDRPAGAHEKIFLLSKSKKYHYDAEAVREPATVSSLQRWSQNIEKQKGSTRANGGAKTNGNMKAVGGHRTDKQRGHGRRHAGFNDRWDEMSKEEQQANGRNLRNVWSIATAPFAEAHFATFPPALVEPCIKAGCPADGVVLDPFGGAGTVGLVASRLQRRAILIELNPEYADIAEARIRADTGPMFSTFKRKEVEAPC